MQIDTQRTTHARGVNPSVARRALHSLKEKPLGAFGGLIILIWILVAIFADALTPYPPSEIHLRDRFQGSSAQYLLGTDHVGRDFLSRLILGGRLSILIGLSITALSTVISTLIGGTSGRKVAIVSRGGVRKNQVTALMPISNALWDHR